MRHTPIKIAHLVTCKPSDFKGHEGLYVKVPVHAHMSTNTLRESLIAYDLWPEGIEVDDIQKAVDEYLGNYPCDLVFNNATTGPEGYFVRQHPTIQRMWLVIDPELQIASSWDTAQEGFEHAIELARLRDRALEYTCTHAYFSLIRVSKWVAEMNAAHTNTTACHELT